MTALGLWARLAVASIVVSLLTDLVLVGLSPRWLLLDPSIVSASSHTALWCMALALALELALMVILARPGFGLLREIASVEPSIEPGAVLSLYALPARMAGLHVGIAAALALTTLFDGVRPIGVDLYTQGALALVALTLVGTASLPLYVMARARVAKVFELIPPTSAKEALALLPRDDGRVRWRFLAAVAAPVSLVAVGATLLVFAHTRSYEASALRDDARAVIAGTADLVDGHDDGRIDALVRAAGFGLHVEIEPTDVPVPYDPDPERTVIAPLEDGRALVRFEPVSVSAATASWALMALASVLVAALLGRQVGAVLSRDVAFARVDIDAMGAEDVMRGSRLIAGARFDVVRALADAIEGLGGVFREFAAAQERAIIARASMERTRAMFLASMSHDLRGPLNAILGFAALASQDTTLFPAQRESLAIIEQRGRELLALIQTVLDSARAEAGQLSLSREMASPGDVVEQAVREARDVLAGSSIEISAQVSAEMPRVSIDASRVSQAIVAIATSAARACERGELVVTADLVGDVLQIDVVAQDGVDGGAARMAEALESPERARRLGSLGLGLLLARAIVGLHGGDVALVPRDDRVVVRMRILVK